jgi:HK97 family phage major capsid protein/HK97 family phage prohead protease
MTVINRAYSILNVKAVSEEKREIRGIATTPSTDRMGDIVEPLGVKFRNPLALLHQHDSARPVGHVTFSKPTAKGIEFTAQVIKVDQPGELKNRVDLAWDEVKAGLVRAVSIGFRPIEMAFMDTGGIRFLESEVLELSLVTIPANADATITSVKSIDHAEMAARGNTGTDWIRTADPDELKAVGIRVKDSNTPAASGDTPKPVVRRTKVAKKSYADLIAEWKATRAEKSAAMEAIMSKDGGETLDAAEQDEFDGIVEELKQIDGQIARLTIAEKNAVATAAAVPSEPKAASERPTVAAVARSAPVEPGVRFARYARCLALSHRDHRDIERVANDLYADRDPEMVGVVKAAVAAVNQGNTTLVGNIGGFGDFVEYLRPKTILGKFGTNGIPALNTVPFRIPLITQDTASSASWVGEGKGKPVTTLTTARTTLDPLKITALAVATMEQLRDSSPSVETVIRNDLARSIVYGIDIAFIDPANAGTSTVKPASITNGLTAITSSGQDIEAVYEDVTAVLATFAAANNDDMSDAVWIMSNSTAMYLSVLRNTMGNREFPELRLDGGTFFGIPVITSSAAGTTVTLLKAGDVWLGDEGGINVSISTEASIEMIDAPTNASIGADPVETTLVSMFQTNSVAFLLERTISWKRRRAAGFKHVTGVTWGVGAS